MSAIPSAIPSVVPVHEKYATSTLPFLPDSVPGVGSGIGFSVMGSSSVVVHDAHAVEHQTDCRTTWLPALAALHPLLQKTNRKHSKRIPAATELGTALPELEYIKLNNHLEILSSRKGCTSM